MRAAHAGSPAQSSAQAAAVLPRAHPDPAPVSVEKTRYGFIVDGVICE